MNKFKSTLGKLFRLITGRKRYVTIKLNDDRYEQDSRGHWRDKETGRYVKSSLVNNFTSEVDT